MLLCSCQTSSSSLLHRGETIEKSISYIVAQALHDVRAVADNVRAVFLWQLLINIGWSEASGSSPLWQEIGLFAVRLLQSNFRTCSKLFTLFPLVPSVCHANQFCTRLPGIGHKGLLENLGNQ